MIVVDVEASGTEYHKHSMVSVGALELENPDNQIYLECRIWDGAHIMKEALQVCGFTEEEVTDKSKPTEGEVIRDFLAWTETCKEKTLIGQNVSFDRDFLKAAAEREHLNWPLKYRTIDTHTLCFMHMTKRGLAIPTDDMGRSDLNLDAVLNYTGIPDEPEPHNALTGAKSHAEVASRLLYGKKLLPDFEKFEIPFEDA